MKDETQSKGKIVRVFLHRGRLCVVWMQDWDKDTIYHNGYVSVTPKNTHKNYNDFYSKNIPEEPTFMDKLDELFGDVVFIGFDTLHAQDTPATQNFEAVLKRTKAFADAVVEARI